MSQFKNVIYPIPAIHLNAGMYNRYELQEMVYHLDALNAQAQAQAGMQPKKEWVGLTKDEVRNIFYACQSHERDYVVASMVEAALKEKNGG